MRSGPGDPAHAKSARVARRRGRHHGGGRGIARGDGTVSVRTRAGGLRLTTGVIARADDGELLVGPRAGEGEVLAVVEAVRVLAGAELLVGGVEAAALGGGLFDLLLGVAVVAAGDGANVGGADVDGSLALVERGDGVRGGGDGPESENEGGLEADHGGGGSGGSK